MPAGRNRAASGAVNTVLYRGVRLTDCLYVVVAAAAAGGAALLCIALCVYSQPG